MLTGRACHMIVGIRTLVARGLDEVAKVVTRSLLENFDIALVAFADPAFAADYFGTTNPKRFWDDEIARGAIHTKAEEVYASSGVRDVFLRERRKKDWERLSSATHASFFSAFAGAAAISLADDSLIPSPLGFIGTRGRAILPEAAAETKEFMATVMHLSSMDAPVDFERDRFDHDPLLLRAVSGFFVLQELLSRHSLSLEPPSFHSQNTKPPAQ